MNKYQHIHFVGIKGVGMASLAIIFKEAGLKVSGSDVPEQYITDISLVNAGINVLNNFSSENINDAQLVIYTGAHGGRDNIEVKSAIEKGINSVSYAEAIGLFMEGAITGNSLKGVSVAGTHGKTTTTAMIATILTKNDFDPSYLIGTSEIPSLGFSGHFGKGDYFVVEADEYATEPKYDARPKFFWQKPKIVIITNIEHDHPDIFPTFESFIEAFKQYLINLPSDSVAVLNGDDRRIQRLLPDIKVRKITYGFNPGNDVVISDIGSSRGNNEFSVKAYGANLGKIELGVPGEHNCINALSAIITCLEVGLTVQQIKKGISFFKGSKRRLEFKNEIYNGALYYDDYAHHPTEIKKTLKTLKNIYPDKKIICIFQPHTYSRTKAFFTEFALAFNDADQVIFMDIFSSAREAVDETVSSIKLSRATAKYHKNSIFLPSIGDVVKYLDELQPGNNTIVLTAGAGDVYKIGDELKPKK